MYGVFIKKLKLARQVELPADLFKGVPPKLAERYAKRAAVEEPFELRRHAEPLRATLLAAYLHRRSEELTDHVVDLLVETIHKMGKKAEARIEASQDETIQKAPGKLKKLYRMAKACVYTPKGTVEDVIEDLGLKGGQVQSKRVPELLTHDELKRFYEAVWFGANRGHMVMLKLLLFTGIRSAELIDLTLKDVDLEKARIRIGKESGDKDRYVFFPPYFREELSPYMRIQEKKGARYLFESNRSQKFTARWIREIVKKYAIKAGITKRIYPHLFRHQILEYLSGKGFSDADLQAVSGHKNRESLGTYKDLHQADIDRAYWKAMKEFPIQ